MTIRRLMVVVAAAAMLLVERHIVHTVAFDTSPSLNRPNLPTRNDCDTRRAFLQQAALSSGAFVYTRAAQASGGATAGGAYLLSAKQRYNRRVTQGVQEFRALKAALTDGNVDRIKQFFAEDGSWKDFSTAGYLLANAFRRNSTAAPDTLPTVKVRSN
jgi:hypothetical protein